MIDLSLDFNEVNFRFINKKNDKQSIDDKLRNMGIDKMELSAIERLTQVGRKATVVKFEEIKISNDCENGISSVSAEIMNEVKKYDLITYYNQKLEERTSFFRKVAVIDIMKFSTNIPKPLTKIVENLHGNAMQMFKNLMSYMGDRKSSKKELAHLNKHLKISLFGPKEIKDEAYCQILKQITEHPNSERCLKGWKFFAILSCCFAPSPDLFYSILNFLLFEIRNSQDRDKVHHANYIFIRIIKSFESKRKHIPSEKEIKHIETLKPMEIPIYFFSETHTFVSVESYHTVKDLKGTIMKKLQFNPERIPYYNLYEICDKEDKLEERFLDDGDKIVDILAVWENEIEDFTKKQKTIDFMLYLKLQLFYNYPQTDIDTITMIYVQTNYEVIQGCFNIKEEMIISLASLQLMANFGSNKELSLQNLQSEVEKYIPRNIFNDNPSITWIEKIHEEINSIEPLSKLGAKITYLEKLKNSVLYQSHQFKVKYSEKLNENNANQSFPLECVLAIKPNGISILDMDKNELEYIGYNVIPSYGMNHELLVLVISKVEGEVNKHYFESYQTKVIQYLLECYTNLIVDKSITEAQLLASVSIKKFEGIPLGNLLEGETYRSRSSSAIKK